MRRGLAEGVERGLAEGVAQGRVALLRRQVEWRFGADIAGQVSLLLAKVTDVARLDEAGKWLLECGAGEALLARLRAGGRRAGNGASASDRRDVSGDRTACRLRSWPVNCRG